MNRIVFFLAGAVAGAAGMAFATSPTGKKVISDVIQGGSGLKENVATRMETLKEDIEDYVAEARFKRTRKDDAPAGEPEAEAPETGADPA
ncbi:MAG: hypothetical protein MI863_24020 [Desulfobacterales bacterium]|nr:hypothetical protein [Desulfobacterales bacterium]